MSLLSPTFHPTDTTSYLTTQPQSRWPSVFRKTSASKQVAAARCQVPALRRDLHYRHCPKWRHNLLQSVHTPEYAHPPDGPIRPDPENAPRCIHNQPTPEAAIPKNRNMFFSLVYSFASLEIDFQPHVVSPSKAIKDLVGRLPLAVAAIGGVGYVLLIEKIVDITRKYGTGSAKIEGITGEKVEESGAGHLPGGGIDLFSIHQQITAAEIPVGKVATKIIVVETCSQILADLKFGTQGCGCLRRSSDFYTFETQLHTGMIRSPVARGYTSLHV